MISSMFGSGYWTPAASSPLCRSMWHGLRLRGPLKTGEINPAAYACLGSCSVGTRTIPALSANCLVMDKLRVISKP